QTIQKQARQLSQFFSRSPEKQLLPLLQQKEKHSFGQVFFFLQTQQKIHSTLSLISLFEKFWISLEKPELEEAHFQWLCHLWNEWETIREDQKTLLFFLNQQLQQTPERFSASVYLALAETFIYTGDQEISPKLMQQARKKGALLSDLLFVEMKYHLAQENYEEAIKFGESLLSTKMEHPPLLVYLLLGKAHKQLAYMEKLAYEDSQDNFESLIHAGEQVQEEEIQRIGYYELAREALPNRPQEALEALESALKLGSVPIQLGCQIQILLGFTLNLLGKLQESILAYQQGSSQAVQFGLYSLAIEGYTSLATTYRELGQFASARQAIASAQQYTRSGCKEYEFLIKLEKARLHLEMFNLEAALDALEEWEFPPRFPGIIQDQHFLHYLEHGHVFLLLGDSPKALKQFNKAIALLNATKDWLFMACAFMYIGALHIEDQDSKKATLALSKAESLARLLDHPFVECWLNYLHGLNSVLKENSFLARKFLAKAEKRIEHYPNLNLYWRILATYGKVLLREGQLLEARQKLEKASEVRQQLLQELTPEEIPFFNRIPISLSLQKSLEIVKQQHYSQSSATSPKKIVEAIKHRLAQSEIDEDTDLEIENKRLKTLFHINEKINSSFNEEALALIVETGIQLPPAERGFLFSSKDGHPYFHVTRNRQKQPIPELKKEVPPEAIQKTLSHGILQTTLAFPEGLRSVIYLPLQTAEKNSGVLGFDWPASDKMPANHITLLQALATQAAIALENIELYQSLEKKKNELARSLKEFEKRNQELQKVHEHLADKVQAQRIEIQEIQGQVAEKQHELEFKYNYDNIIGRSSKIREIFKILDKVIDSKVPVLIHGESGTGKELIARAIHFNGERRKKNFCAENCAALSDSLLESELFGYVKGAFTGAIHDRKGLFELADQGTLLLDEVGDMSLEMQKKLLRVLQENEIRRLGSKKNISVNVRILSATHRDLRAMTAEGLFREDLYYRLNVVQIKLPALREHPEDIPFLLEHFLKLFHQKNLGQTKVTGISQGALELLQQYSWPGNIRELQNIVMSAASLAESETLTESDFQDKINRKKMSLSRSSKELLEQELSLDDFLKKIMESCQDQYNATQLAQILGLTRKTLWQKRKSWGIK
ncbi:MAG: sigma 54-interacting transcriptional regulator, partial [Planctomycetota bacterium]